MVTVRSSYSFPLPGNAKAERPCEESESEWLKGEFNRRKRSMILEFNVVSGEGSFGSLVLRFTVKIHLMAYSVIQQR